jgi:glucosyl-3-phosphoglycerate synthase
VSSSALVSVERDDRMADLAARKGSTVVSACIPARDEAATIATVARHLVALQTAGIVDEILVIDDRSHDDTVARAAEAGATVLANTGTPGKGGAMGTAAGAASGDVLLFADGDVTSYTPAAFAALLEPLLIRPEVQLVKASYRRSLHGAPGEGGRVTELVARPLLRRFHPGLAGIDQPLAGETAVRRSALKGITFAPGYGVEIGLLIDVHLVHGLDAIAQVDLGSRTHRNRPLHQLRTHAQDVLEAVLARTTPLGGNP